LEREAAITGAASEVRVTQNNDWYFRLFKNASGQGQFLADYVRYRFGARQIAVIREKGTAGEEFAAALRDRARSQGVRISADLELAPAQAKDATALPVAEPTTPTATSTPPVSSLKKPPARPPGFALALQRAKDAENQGRFEDALQGYELASALDPSDASIKRHIALLRARISKENDLIR